MQSSGYSYRYFNLDVAFDTPIQIQFEQNFENVDMSHKGFPIRVVLTQNIDEKITYEFSKGQIHDKIISMEMVLKPGIYLMCAQIQLLSDSHVKEFELIVTTHSKCPLILTNRYT